MQTYFKYCVQCSKAFVGSGYLCQDCKKSAEKSSASKKAAGRKTDLFESKWYTLGVYLPIVALIIFLANRKKNPDKAREAGRGAILGAVLYLVIIILCLILFL